MQRTARTIFGGLARSYDFTVDWATLFQDRRWKAWVAARLEGPGEALDIGCGTLLFEERFARADMRFVGIDLTWEMVRAGMDKGLRNVVAVLNGDAEALPFSDDTFPIIVSCYVAKYVDVTKFASELARVAKPGAQVLLYDFARPIGPFAPFLEIYIRGGLRAVGLVLRLARRRAAFTYEELPRIIDRSDWDRRLVGAMESVGFQTVAAERLTGGVVFAYCGRKGS